jgi:hypothetical protein
LNRDKLNHVNPERVAQASLSILDKVTDLDAEVQPAAVAMTLIAFARRVGVDVGDLFTVARNILGSKDAEGPSFTAIQLYMKHEV